MKKICVDCEKTVRYTNGGFLRVIAIKRVDGKPIMYTRCQADEAKRSAEVK